MTDDPPRYYWLLRNATLDRDQSSEWVRCRVEPDVWEPPPKPRPQRQTRKT